MKAMKECKAKGGAAGDTDQGPAEPLKKGGKAKKAHHASGGAAKSRLDKRARGGKVMTPKAPLSGAAPSTMRPGYSGSQSIGKESN